MQTHFTPEQLANPLIQQADDILRKCVHCGFCTATCPTFVLTGDERDSPRGRIWMIRDMLEAEEPIAPQETAYHLDRCLTCLSCTTTCPSGVDYMHLVDIGRHHIETHGKRDFLDRSLRSVLGYIIPRAWLFHKALILAWLARPLKGLFTGRLRAMLSLAPKRLRALDKIGSQDAVYPAQTKKIGRVALLAGCAQRAIDPDINAATIALLNRIGVEVVIKQKAYCCGALSHHINDEVGAKAAMRSSVSAWADEIAQDGLDAIIVNTSGCGTTLKDYVNLLADDEAYCDKAQQISALSRDITEYLFNLNALKSLPARDEIVAYHAACSLQHGQKILDAPKMLLQNAGFQVRQPKNSHLCCGSAGVYNVLQPDMAGQLQERKVKSLDDTAADMIVAGNLGCINQLAGTKAPIMHTIQLLNWAYGGDKPDNLPDSLANNSKRQ